MVSAKIVHKIEDHWEAITGRFLRSLRNHTGLPHLARLPESEITETCRRILHNLGHWLVASSETEIGALYRHVGRLKRAEGMPLSEAIRGLQLMKDATLAFLEDESPIRNALEVQAEEEFELRFAHFFDLLIFSMACGYEEEDQPKRRAHSA